MSRRVDIENGAPFTLIVSFWTQGSWAAYATPPPRGKLNHESGPGGEKWSSPRSAKRSEVFTRASRTQNQVDLSLFEKQIAVNAQTEISATRSWCSRYGLRLRPRKYCVVEANGVTVLARCSELLRDILVALLSSVTIEQFGLKWKSSISTTKMQYLNNQPLTVFKNSIKIWIYSKYASL